LLVKAEGNCGLGKAKWAVILGRCNNVGHAEKSGWAWVRIYPIFRHYISAPCPAHYVCELVSLSILTINKFAIKCNKATAQWASEVVRPAQQNLYKSKTLNHVAKAKHHFLSTHWLINMWVYHYIQRITTRMRSTLTN